MVVQPAIGYYESGKIREEFTWKEGLLEGPAKRYFDNGQVQEQVTYKDGAPNGLAEFFIRTARKNPPLPTRMGSKTAPLIFTRKTGVWWVSSTLRTASWPRSSKKDLRSASFQKRTCLESEVATSCGEARRRSTVLPVDPAHSHIRLHKRVRSRRRALRLDLLRPDRRRLLRRNGFDRRSRRRAAKGRCARSRHAGRTGCGLRGSRGSLCPLQKWPGPHGRDRPHRFDDTLFDLPNCSIPRVRRRTSPSGREGQRDRHLPSLRDRRFSDHARLGQRQYLEAIFGRPWACRRWPNIRGTDRTRLNPQRQKAKVQEKKKEL